MSRPSRVHWHSSHFQDHVCKIYNLPSEGVVDLTGYIKCGGLIAAGGSGQIFKGNWREPNHSSTLSFGQHALPNVVVKLISIPVLTDEKKKDKRFKRMKREVELWKQINHRNILPLVGIARIDGDDNRPALISPWMEYGNVPDFLKQNPTFPAVSFLHDIIEGLHFLHTFNPEIIHGDIKGVNALVNYRKEAYLCDFGLSRFVVDNTLWRTTATHASGTLRWMAPELIEGETCTSTKASDIYAYGMTCYEILSGKAPFDTARNDGHLVVKVLRGDRPERIILCHPDGLWSIITQCWAQDAKERPSTGEVLKSVVQLIEGSDKLKEEIINIGKNVKVMVPYPEKSSIETRMSYGQLEGEEHRKGDRRRREEGTNSHRADHRLPSAFVPEEPADYPREDKERITRAAEEDIRFNVGPKSPGARWARRLMRRIRPERVIDPYTMSELSCSLHVAYADACYRYPRLPASFISRSYVDFLPLHVAHRHHRSYVAIAITSG